MGTSTQFYVTKSGVKKHDTCQKDHGVPNRGSGVGGKWMFWIWYHLLSGTKRVSELQKLLMGASPV
ncbi:hypothetical protein KSF_010110 [Reticulibacter mediterranei]|uniref:HTH hxlR-type domain-containing protein n=1 Tax=Reticulibacter mediterranei TaxID=2778369 RepID=A0A8J3ICC4_9CHLR|nr:winged helix-turn-helix transcriptional regulator [Reticulibacter mediterranei]GHO90963.1 hypothetical protein KSF_010110 [Reticulibacter mediterranei]